MYFISKILLTSLLLLVVEKLVNGVSIDSLYIAIIAAIVIGLLNAIIKPILVILTLPISIVTLGLFIFVINAALFMLAASFLAGFTVDSFWSALLASIIVSLGSTVGNKFIPK